MTSHTRLAEIGLGTVINYHLGQLAISSCQSHCTLFDARLLVSLGSLRFVYIKINSAYITTQDETVLQCILRF